MNKTPLERTMGIALTQEQYSLLKRYSTLQNRSVSYIIRESLDWGAIMKAITVTRNPKKCFSHPITEKTSD